MDPLEILSARGKEDLSSLWRLSKVGTVQKVFDYIARTYAFKLTGVPCTSCRITSPAHPFHSLEIEHAYVCLQVYVAPRKDFSFEVEASVQRVTDTRRSTKKLVFSTYQSAFSVHGSHAKWTLNPQIRGQWCNIVVPIRELVCEAWPDATFECIRSVSICANCSIRRLFFIKALPDVAVENYECGLMNPNWIPRNFVLKTAIFCPSYILSHAFLSGSDRNIDGNMCLHRAKRSPSLLAQGKSLLPPKMVPGRRPNAASAPIRSSRGGSKPGLTAEKRWASLPRLETVDIILARRIDEVLAGPNETVRYDCSDDEDEEVQHDSTVDHDNEQQVPEQEQEETDRFDEASDSNAARNEHVQIYLDTEEQEMLASLQKLSRRYSLSSSFNSQIASNPLSPTRLKKHEFDDDTDGEGSLEVYTRPVSRVSPAADVELHRLDASQTSITSLKSDRLRHKNLEPSFEWWKDDSPPSGSGTADSGLGDGLCPSLDLIFDPDLNCYYHPVTQQYFSVTS